MVQTGVSLNCLAFANEIMFYVHKLQTPVKQIEILQQIAGETSLSIYTECMEPEKTEPPSSIVRRTEKCKYLGEMLTTDGNGKEPRERERGRWKWLLSRAVLLTNISCLRQN